MINGAVPDEKREKKSRYKRHFPAAPYKIEVKPPKDIDMIKRIPLEKAALQVCIDNSKPPLIFQLPPWQGRMKLDEAQNAPVYMYPASVGMTNFNTGRWGVIRVYIVRPENCSPDADTILYIHGAGWVFGNFHTHEKLVRELAARTGSVVVFPEYSLSPEAKYPTAIEQCYSLLCALPAFTRETGGPFNLDRLSVAGDSVGGNMAIAMTLMAKFRCGPGIARQLLFYPVTNACFDTCTYREFATDYYLYRDGMIWFWNQYTRCEADRAQITASPLRAGLEQLAGLPPALIINGEADVLRDEGEAYASKLLQAGVDVTSVRIRATIHDFVMLNALDQTNACRAAMDLAVSWFLRKG